MTLQGTLLSILELGHTFWRALRPTRSEETSGPWEETFHTKEGSLKRCFHGKKRIEPWETTIVSVSSVLVGLDKVLCDSLCFQKIEIWLGLQTLFIPRCVEEKSYFFADSLYCMLSELSHCTEQGLGLPTSFPVVALSRVTTAVTQGCS